MINTYTEKEYDEALHLSNKKFDDIIRFYLTLSLSIPTIPYSDIHLMVVKIEQLKAEAEKLILQIYQNQ